MAADSYAQWKKLRIAYLEGVHNGAEHAAYLERAHGPVDATLDELRADNRALALSSQKGNQSHRAYRAYRLGYERGYRSQTWRKP